MKHSLMHAGEHVLLELGPVGEKQLKDFDDLLAEFIASVINFAVLRHSFEHVNLVKQHSEF